MKTTATQTEPSNKKNCAGVSLVEVLVALSLFALFIAGASKALLSNRALADLTREHYTAANIAKNRIELARTFEFDSLSKFAEAPQLVDISGESLSGDSGRYRRTTVIALTNNVAELTVTVEIRDHKTLDFEGSEEQVKTFIAFHP
ncbi:MAG: prepilin-type N-terminal cleavage/methylation domain-containing protein [Pontiella sp.]